MPLGGFFAFFFLWHGISGRVGYSLARRFIQREESTRPHSRQIAFPPRWLDCGTTTLTDCWRDESRRVRDYRVGRLLYKVFLPSEKPGSRLSFRLVAPCAIVARRSTRASLG